MKKVLIILMVLPLFAVAQMTEGLLDLTEITVKQGHNAQFLAGVKQWKDCYTKENGPDSWSFWSRVQGEGRVYGISSAMVNWAEMDKDPTAASKSCRMMVDNLIMPHIEKIDYNITKGLTDWSKKSATDQPKLVWVTYFRVKNGIAFSEIIKEMTDVMVSVEGEPRGQWYRFMGGAEDAPHYMVSDLFTSYAALDEDEKRDGPFKMYKKAKGDKKAAQLMEKWMSAVDAQWSYIWELNVELSN